MSTWSETTTPRVQCYYQIFTSSAQKTKRALNQLKACHLERVYLETPFAVT